jgi:hypothetical protein
MTSDTTIRTARFRRRKPDKHIVVSRRRRAQSRDARLVMWLAGWQIEIYDEHDEQSDVSTAIEAVS